MVIITGLSGAGKSSALKVLEDIGFFCVDNLPITLLPSFLKICTQTQRGEEISRIALVVDVRERGFLKDITRILEEVKKEGYRCEVIYLDSNDESLIRRFKETRRRHPLGGEVSLLEGIRAEREKLFVLKEKADKVIDTSEFTVHRLKEVLHDYFSYLLLDTQLTVNLVSFSYKYGVPSDADIMLDVRFLPNPFFENSLKDLNGNDERVKEYILKREETRIFLNKVLSLLEFLLPLYIKEGKPYITVAIGCTGGRHRSVCIVNWLFEQLMNGKGYAIKKRHRDIDR